MRLYFMRHGHAEDPTLGQPDEARAITPEGFTRLAHAARFAKSMPIAPAHILASPRVRAQQTAQVIADALQMPVTTRDEVNFQFSLELVRLLTSEFKGDLMFVGHNPSMSEVINRLTGANVGMKKGAIACVETYSIQAGRGELVWLITPSVFATLDSA